MISRLAVVVAAVAVLAGCTTFKVQYADGTVVSASGAPLVSRSDKFVVTHQWLGADNVLHEVRVARNTDENANAQVEVMREAFALGKAAAAAGAAP